MNSRLALLASWVLALALLGGYALAKLRVSGDLRTFLPAARTPLQGLLLHELGDGSGARTLILAIRTSDPARAAVLSRAMHRRLLADGYFRSVQNGEGGLGQIAAGLLPYRYLLSSTLDHHRFDAAYLRDQLEKRLDDLGSPGASLLKPLLPSDPTLETVKIAESWAPQGSPPLRDGVWYAHGAALLLLETNAGGFDPAAQAVAVESIRHAYAGIPGHAQATLEISGPGYFGVQIQRLTRDSAERLGALSAIGLMLLLLMAYGRVRESLVAALPLATAAVAGATMLALVYGRVHGLTLAFGVTLLGVAQEYPLRLLSHRRAGEDARATARALGPVLLLAMASTLVAYFAFFAAGVAGLAQLALFTLTGILAAGTSTRWLLPALVPPVRHDAGLSPWLGCLAGRLRRLPSPVMPSLLLGTAALLAAMLVPAPWWQSNLAKLAPVPTSLLRREAALRKALGAPDVRYLLVLEGTSAQDVLERSARAAKAFAPLLQSGQLGKLQLPSTYLPPVAVQRARQARLPDTATLRAALTKALAGLPFQPGLFKPFEQDVARARTLPPLTPSKFERSPLGGLLRAMLIHRDGHWFGVGLMSGVRNPSAVAKLAAATSGRIHLVDLKTESEHWVASYRTRILHALAGAATLLVLLVALGLRHARSALRVLSAVLLAQMLTVAALRLIAGSLSLFHLVALLLAAGLGLHYALFFERARTADEPERLRTLHATLTCAASTLLAFGLYALAPIPVLRALGLTVALGIAANLIAAMLLTWPRKTPSC